MKSSIALVSIFICIISVTLISADKYACKFKRGKGVSVKKGFKRPNAKSHIGCRDKCLKLKQTIIGKKVDGLYFSLSGGCYCLKEMRRIDESAKFSNKYMSCHIKENPSNVLNGVNKPPPPGSGPVIDLTYAYFKDMHCDTTWTKIGCYNVRARGRLLLNYRYDIEWEMDRHPAFAHSLLCACAEAARINHVQYFATHFWGECWELDQEDLVQQSDKGCLLADGKHENQCRSIADPGLCLGTTSYYVYTNVAPDEDEVKRGNMKRGIPKRDYVRKDYVRPDYV